MSCSTASPGSVGLAPTLAVLETGATLALANKESLIVGGELVTSAARPGQIVPVDSEHSAIAQALRSGEHGEVRRLVLTASGGPFRGRTRDQLADVTPEQALAHPTWDMGLVITTNSATLVNKGLEVIEAHLLFDIPYDRIEAVGAPAVDRALDGRVRGWLDHRPGVAARHAAADLARPGLAAPRARRRSAARLDAAPRTGRSSRSTTTRSPRCASPSGSEWPAAPTLPCSTRPTSRRCRRSTPGGSRTSSILAVVERVVDQHEPAAELTLEGVLEAERWARDAADRALAGRSPSSAVGRRAAGPVRGRRVPRLPDVACARGNRAALHPRRGDHRRRGRALDRAARDRPPHPGEAVRGQGRRSG